MGLRRKKPADGAESYHGFPQKVADVPLERKGWRRYLPFGRTKGVFRLQLPSGARLKPTKSRFVVENEAVMDLRKKTLHEFGVPQQNIARALRLFRIRKAASYASSSTGYCSRNAALAFVDMLEQEMRELVHNSVAKPGTFSEKTRNKLDTIQNTLNSIRKFISTTNVVERIRMRRLKNSPMLMMRMSVAETTELAINPTAEKTSRIVDLGLMLPRVVRMISEEQLIRLIGKDYYDELEKVVQDYRRVEAD